MCIRDRITGEQINYQYLSTGETLQLLKNQKPYEWIRGFYEQKSYTVAENVAYDKTLLQQQVTALKDVYKRQGSFLV